MIHYRIQPSTGLKGVCRPPGDKSITHRALIFGSIAKGRTTIAAHCRGQDIESTISCLQALGVTIHRTPDGLAVDGGPLKPSSLPLHCGNSGTTMRLLMGLLATQPFESTLIGDESLNKRPMKRITQPLAEAGVRFKGSGKLPPITMTGNNNLKRIHHEMPIASAQVKTALALAALQANGGLIRGGQSSRDHSSRMLDQMGCNLKFENGDLEISPSQLYATSIYVPADFSAAAFFIVGALIIPGSHIQLHDVSLNPTRTGLLLAIQEMGGQVEILNRKQANGEMRGDITVRYSALHGWHCPAELVPTLIDELPLLAVLGIHATGKTTVEGAGELRVKESDRISAICKGLTNLGAEITETADGFQIEGQQYLEGGEATSFGDHRIAMGLSIAAMAAKKTSVIHDVACVSTSFPLFAELMQSLSKATISEESIT